jgi:DNA-binding HxlR family transcriptional regulator
MVDSIQNETETEMPVIVKPCPLEELLCLIGGKWKAIVLWHLQSGTMRFGQLRKTMPGITQKMLTQQLRELEGDGLITRTIYAEVPPRVEYSLTPLGKALKPLLRQMHDWSVRHVLAKR